VLGAVGRDLRRGLGLAREQFRGGAEAIAHTTGHSRHDAVVDVRLFVPYALEHGLRHLQHRRSAAAREGAARVGAVVEQGPFGDHRPLGKGGEVRPPPLQAADHLDLAGQHNAQPVARGGFVEEARPGVVLDDPPPADDRRQLADRHADRAGGRL
jgi:hypothetical protein